MKRVLIFLLLTVSISACSVNNSGNNTKTNLALKKETQKINETGKEEKPYLINKGAMTVSGRIMVPEGFERVKVEKGSFEEYLRNLPLKPHGSKVRYYNGEIKPDDVYEAVLDIDVGGRDLQQCADAAIRLRAEYLYGKRLFDKIHFNFTDGFKADYATWSQGNRIRVEGNRTYWVKTGDAV